MTVVLSLTFGSGEQFRALCVTCKIIPVSLTCSTKLFAEVQYLQSLQKDISLCSENSYRKWENLSALLYIELKECLFKYYHVNNQTVWLGGKDSFVCKVCSTGNVDQPVHLFILFRTFALQKPQNMQANLRFCLDIVDCSMCYGIYVYCIY